MWILDDESLSVAKARPWHPRVSSHHHVRMSASHYQDAARCLLQTAQVELCCHLFRGLIQLN
jgi:hypothetical protein